MEREDETYILGDIDAFMVALENGSMQAQWNKDQSKFQAWIRHGTTPDCDPSED